jgi:hypothetical protein
VAPAGVLGGFAAARYSGRRALGGAAFAAAGALCFREWARAPGPAAAGLAALYAAAMLASRPPVEKIRPWTSVPAVSTVTAAASEVAMRSGTLSPARRRSGRTAG